MRFSFLDLASSMSAKIALIVIGMGAMTGSAL